jgi:Protein of unknown function (DUF3054)
VNTLAPNRSAAVLVPTDAVAIIVFATVGLLSHHKGLSLHGYARDALPIMVGWFGAAILFRTYITHRQKRVLATWIVGVTAGVLARALILGHSLNGKEAEFWGVALVFVLLFVYLLRSVVGVFSSPPS